MNQLQPGTTGRLPHTPDEDVWQLLTQVRRRRRARLLAASVLAIVLGVLITLAVRTTTFDGLFAGADAPVEPEAAPLATVSRTPMLDETKPFATTPAADWADGADGITPLAAVATGTFNADEVAEALREVREILIASRLDPPLLVGHDPTAFLGMLAPDARDQLAPLFGAGRAAEVASLVSMIAQGSVLLPVEPKVDGQMSVRAGKTGELVVRTNYVFVYAFRPDGPIRLVDAMDVIVVVRADVDYVLRTGRHWAPGSQGLWYGDTAGHVYSIACDAYRAGYLAPAYAERVLTTNPAMPPTYFDPASPIPPASGCPD